MARSRHWTAGTFAADIATTRAARADDIAHRRAPITGVSEFAFPGEAPVRPQAGRRRAPAAAARSRIATRPSFEALRDRDARPRPARAHGLPRCPRPVRRAQRARWVCDEPVPGCRARGRRRVGGAGRDRGCLRRERHVGGLPVLLGQGLRRDRRAGGCCLEGGRSQVRVDRGQAGQGRGGRPRGRHRRLPLRRAVDALDVLRPGPDLLGVA